ncbi:MAG: aminotransferase class III-fold pyridoxal phosphate-dependent enzyme [bacterium]|nr:aminotransferase class III-fold pyridoxal phosphate-dependent enzyme [bacterium]MDZ4345018.1 aminotransferase class III-fold pyridoxal phosphate-dependent enzyme [Candidatus Binatia bacterium]
MKRFKKSNKFFKKVSRVIPLASQTFSKSYLQFIKGQAPLFLERGAGARVWDIDGHEYIDFINGLLSVILGYRYPAVDKAIKKQLERGISLSLSSPLEYELAELLKKHIPCAEMVRFGKNGSDVTSGAVRLARAVTKRDHIIVCGYHGWHDWYIGSTTRHLGVPESTRKLTHKFVYNNIDSLEKILKRYKGQVAAVIMEPMSYEEPKDNFLQKVKKITHEHGALLIFDEVITGFHFSLGGAQKYYGVTPDLAAFGKAMANGMPIAALVGRRKYMQKVGDIFYSFTFGGEALSLAAAIATIKEMERRNVIGYLWRLGKYLQDNTRGLLAKYGLDVIIKVEGKPFWQVFIISQHKKYSGLEIKSFIQQEVLQAGFLWYGQHNMSFSHTRRDIDKLLVAYDDIFGRLKEYLESDKLRRHLKGKPITNIFKVR